MLATKVIQNLDGQIHSAIIRVAGEWAIRSLHDISEPKEIPDKLKTNFSQSYFDLLEIITPPLKLDR